MAQRIRWLQGVAGLAALLAWSAIAHAADGAEAWAKAHSFSTGNITPTNLESGWGPGFRNLSFTLTKDEEADAKAAVKLAERWRERSDRQPAFAKPSTRDALQALLKKQPHAFYVEFLLGQWETQFGNAAEGARLTAASYADAPAILAQRYQFDDGRPLANRLIDSFALECNRVTNGSLDPSLQLEYFSLHTDADGYLYVPAYNTVYRANDLATPAGYDVAWPRLGWFETPQKVGILPAAIVTEKDGDFLPLAKKDAPPTAAVTLADGTKVTIEAISHYPPTGDNPWWKPNGAPADESVKAAAPGLSPWPAEEGFCFLLRFSQALPKRDLTFEFSAPTSAKNHYTTVRAQDLPRPFFLYVGLPTHPDCVSIRIGVTGAVWKVAAESKGPGENGIFTFEEPKVENGRTSIRVKHEKLDGEVRLRAVDVAGKVHAPIGVRSGSESNREGVTYEDGGDFDLAPENIASFRLETRDYQWAEFGNIAVQPKK